MSAMLDYMQLCRLCLVKEKVNVPIFDDENDVRQIFLKITACLPVKVTQEDNLPKKICDSCLYKVDLLYQFWNTTVNAEKQLIQWLTEIGVEVNIKNSDTQTLPILPQSHAHPHSIPVSVQELKEEKPDIVEKPGFPMPEHQNMYPGYDTLGYPQPEVTMEVGAENTFVQPDPVEEPLPPEPPAPTPKKRGRPAGAVNKKSPPKKKPTPAPPVVSPRTNSTRRSSATAAAAAVAAAAAAVTDSEEDSDGDRLGGMGYDDSDSDDDPIAKEEIDSDEDYVEPKSFLGVPSSADGEQPGPSGLGGAKGDATGANATESGPIEAQESPQKGMMMVLCPVCMKPIRQTLLPKHIRRHTHRNHTCNICNKSFVFVCELRSHQKQQGCSSGSGTLSSSAVPLQCEVCNSHFKTPHTLQMHQRRHTGDFRYHCAQCKRGFVYTTEYKFHMESVHEGRRYKCEKCNKSFVEKNYFKKHLKSHDNDDDADKSPLNSEMNFQCTVADCGKRFDSNSKLIKHSYVHRRATAICQVCGKMFKSSATLNYHMLIHSDERPFVCSICGKAFRLSVTLRKHQRTHNSVRAFPCTECDKRFARSESLKIHLRQHTGERPFICDLCPQSYTTKYAMKTHRAIQHGVAIYKRNKNELIKEPLKLSCNLCSSVFSSKSGLYNHKQTIHKHVVHPCSVCGKKLTSKSSLRDHARLHTGEKPFPCSKCDKRFNKQALLDTHMRIHTGIRPFECTICGKKFTQRISLTIHRRYHTGEKPYSCNLCEQRFITKTIMNMHIKTKHSITLKN